MKLSSALIFLDPYCLIEYLEHKYSNIVTYLEIYFCKYFCQLKILNYGYNIAHGGKNRIVRQGELKFNTSNCTKRQTTTREMSFFRLFFFSFFSDKSALEWPVTK